jgi:protein-tyrosine phosphatase
MLACSPNFRMVSGLIGRDGRALVAGCLYRSDALIDPLPDDQAALAALGIGLVFDLRSATERSRAPGHYWDAAGVDVQGVDMLAHIEGGSEPWHAFKAQPDTQGAEATMQALYAGFPAALHGQLLSLVEAVAACDKAVLIHCTAGKDRTGFAVAILMASLGVPMPQIMADYLASLGRSNAQAREETRQLTAARLGFELADDALDRLMTVHESYLAASFARVEQDFGGVEAYLSTAGISAKHIAALEALLLT